MVVVDLVVVNLSHITEIMMMIIEIAILQWYLAAWSPNLKANGSHGDTDRLEFRF